MDTDLFFAFEKVHSTGTITVTVCEIVLTGDLEITAAVFTDTVQEDLYDFDFGIGTQFSIQASTVQAGYPTLGVSGHVMRNEVLVNGEVSTVIGYQF